MVRIGHKLQEKRLQKGLTIEEIAQATKIRPSFISAIEKGEYNKLPASTYAQGFVQNYADYLGLPKKETLALFRREFDSERSFRVLPKTLDQQADFPIHKVRVSKMVYLVIVVFLCFAGYLMFQYRGAFINPPLEITTPVDGSVVKAQTIEVRGKTDPAASVYINNDLTSVDSNGIFTKHVEILSGEESITIRAVNTFHKETVIQRSIKVQ